MAAVYAASEEPVFAVAWSDGRQRVFSTGRDRVIHAWHSADGKDAGEVPRADADLLHLATAPGLLFSSAADGTIRSYSQEKLTPAGDVVKLPDCAYAIAVDSAGHRMAAGCYDGTVRIWNIGDG